MCDRIDGHHDAEMDGYETMQVIRQNAMFARLPIIALTAKGHEGDREKCLEAGASEYLAKQSILTNCFPRCVCGFTDKSSPCLECGPGPHQMKDGARTYL